MEAGEGVGQRPGRVVPVEEDNRAPSGKLDLADAQGVVANRRGGRGGRQQLAQHRQPVPAGSP